MKPPARELSEPEPLPTERFVDRGDTKSQLLNIEESLRTLNSELNHPSLNGSALFGLQIDDNPESLLSIGGTIALVNADNVEPHRLNFGENILKRRKSLLDAAAYGDCVQERQPLFQFSKMNLEDDITYSYPVFSEDSQSVIGVVQHAFYYPGNDLPEENELHIFRDDNQKTINQISRSLQWLYQVQPDLLTALELAPAVNSNRFAIRWDVTNENLLRQIDYGTYMRYIQHSKQIAEAIVKAHCPTAVLASIDDQNIIIEFPKYIKRDHLNDVVEIKIFQNREIAQLSQQINHALSNIAESYKNAFIPNLKPNMQTSFGNGFFEKDTEGKLQSPLLHDLQRQNLSH